MPYVSRDIWSIRKVFLLPFLFYEVLCCSALWNHIGKPCTFVSEMCLPSSVLSALVPAAFATAAAFWAVDSVSGRLFIPYLIWITYAAGLNYAIVQRNPKVRIASFNWMQGMRLPGGINLFYLCWLGSKVVADPLMGMSGCKGDVRFRVVQLGLILRHVGHVWEFSIGHWRNVWSWLCLFSLDRLGSASPIWTCRSFQKRTKHRLSKGSQKKSNGYLREINIIAGSKSRMCIFSWCYLWTVESSNMLVHVKIVFVHRSFYANCRFFARVSLVEDPVW